jgi:Pyruvate/2-oxoacid:ferredoxin oxidoreductase delta subunit
MTTPAYDHALLYFLSGTGNSYRAATWIAEAGTRRGIPTRLTSIREAQPGTEIRTDGTALLGLVFPTHAFTTPWRMLRFVARLPRRRGTHALVVATRAGMKLGRWFTPGLEGTAAVLGGLLLWLKGYSVRAVMGLDMPSNWTVLHPGFSRSSAEAIEAHSAPHIELMMDALVSGRRRLRGWVSLALGLALIPISLAYLVMGRFALAKMMYASDRCNGCGLCAQACPAGAIRMWGKEHPRPYWTFSCESCMRCMNYCPLRAVEASYPLIVLLYYVTSFPIWMVALNGLAARWAPLAALSGAWAEAVLQYLYSLLALGLSYLAFSALIRIRPVNRLLTAATLTHYSRRYHEPGTRLKDIL